MCIKAYKSFSFGHYSSWHLKSEYVMEEKTHSLWVTLQGRYEQQKTFLLPEANHKWTQIHLQDFKSIEDYNHAIHKVHAKL
jgi:hypothetical protein